MLLWSFGKREKNLKCVLSLVVFHTYVKEQEPIPQHSLAKEVEQSYWMMFHVLGPKQSLLCVAMTPTLVIAIMERMLV